MVSAPTSSLLKKPISGNIVKEKSLPRVPHVNQAPYRHGCRGGPGHPAHGIAPKTFSKGDLGTLVMAFSVF